MNPTPPLWVEDSIFYLIFPDRFANGDSHNDPPGTSPWGSMPGRDTFAGGDIQGILDHLPYLQELGVTALYLTPIFKARTNHKYDTCDYMEIDEAFGSQALFRQLVDEMHGRGMRLVLDAVFNHCGDGFWAFEDVLQNGAASRYAPWFFPRGYPLSQEPPNYQTCGGTAYLPKLNLTHPDLQEYLLNVATYWIKEFGIDGWRLDVPWKASMEFWLAMRRTVKQEHPQAYIVGELWRDPQPWIQGDTCDGLMNYPLRDYILDYCVRDTMDAEDFDYFVFRLLQTYGGTASYQLNLLGSHDTARIMTICRGDTKRLLLALTAQFTLPGVPMIYYGDEVGLTGENDPDCRRCMTWDEADWNKLVYEAHRSLIRLRREHAAIRKGTLESLLVFNGVYAYRRSVEGDEIIVVLNPRQKQSALKIPLSGAGRTSRNWRDLFSGKTYIAQHGIILLDEIADQTALILIPA